MPTIVGSATGGSAVDQGAPGEPVTDALEHAVGGIRLHLEPDEVAVVGSGAVAAAEVVGRDDDDTSLGEELGLAEPGAPRRVQVPVAPVVRAAGDGDDHERSRRQLLGAGGDDRHADLEWLDVVHGRGHVDPALATDHATRFCDATPAARSSPLSTLPLALSGSASTSSTRRGTL